MGRDELKFGDFRLLPSRRLLLEGEAAVPIGSRALDLLIVLLERAGDLVSKEELMRRVWPETQVVEGNLTVHIATLRRILRDGRQGRRYIVNIPGRGYRFVEPVGLAPLAGAFTSGVPRHNLPSRLTRLIGRDLVIHDLADQLPRQRFATITGPAGVGKCSVANAVAGLLLPAYRHGAWRVDLATITDFDRVPGAVAAALGLDIGLTNPPSRLVEVFRDKQLLLLLGNCDQVLEGAASLAVQLLETAPAVHVLATSREPLRTGGEHVRPLTPLACPPAERPIVAVRALRFPAVELFVERAAATLGSYNLTNADAPVVAEICRKLDGLPLAIELAAGRVDVLGVRALADQVCDDLTLLAGNNRSADPRHQTAEAALDWSYAMLTSEQAAVFRRLSMLAGPFTLDIAAAFASQPSAGRVAARVAELAAKSLLAVDLNGAEPRFRMLETTRKYALRKLAETGEFEPPASGHAAQLPRLTQHNGQAGCRPRHRTRSAMDQPQYQAQGHAQDQASHRGEIDGRSAMLDVSGQPAKIQRRQDRQQQAGEQNQEAKDDEKALHAAAAQTCRLAGRVGLRTSATTPDPQEPSLAVPARSMNKRTSKTGREHARKRLQEQIK